MKDLIFGIGTRPNIIKLKALTDAANAANITYDIYDTHQHNDPEMCGDLYRFFSLPRPVTVPPEKHAYNIGVVIGDTDSTRNCAILFSQLGLPVAHVEAGGRCGKNIPEEVNRKIVDAIATWNFCATERCTKNCGNAYFVGDVLRDMFLRYYQYGCNPPIQRIALVTIHRQENTKSFEDVYGLLSDACTDYDLILFPVHPRIQGMSEFPRGVLPMRPQSYISTMYLLSVVDRVFTDSGGLQREAYWAGVPTTLLRKETEWPETLKPGNERDFGDGNAAVKIMDILKEAL